MDTCITEVSVPTGLSLGFAAKAQKLTDINNRRQMLPWDYDYSCAQGRFKTSLSLETRKFYESDKPIYAWMGALGSYGGVARKGNSWCRKIEKA